MSSTFDLLAGLGLQVIVVELTGSDADLLSDLQSARIVIMRDDDEEIVGDHIASGAFAAAEPAGHDAALWTEEYEGVFETYERHFLRIAHDFDVRGTYIAALSITTSDGQTTTSARGIRIGIGDGLPMGIEY